MSPGEARLRRGVSDCVTGARFEAKGVDGVDGLPAPLGDFEK